MDCGKMWGMQIMLCGCCVCCVGVGVWGYVWMLCLEVKWIEDIWMNQIHNEALKGVMRSVWEK